MSTHRANVTGIFLLVVVSWACLGSAGDSIQGDVQGLYDADPGRRTAAVARLIAHGQKSVPYLDPSNSGCLDPATMPSRCKNYDRALREVITVLEGIAIRHDQKGVGEPNAAKDLLWTMLNDPAEDAFTLNGNAEWDPPKATLLKSLATQSLNRAMTISEDLSEAEASRRAVSRVKDQELGWYLLENCAGASMYAGCNYGSYLFNHDGTRVSFRLIHHDDRDSVGAGVTVELFLDAGLKSVGYLRARGGFGGERQQLVFYNLRADQAPLCSLSSSDSRRDLAKDYPRLVSVSPGGCRVLERDPSVEVEDFKGQAGSTVAQPEIPPKRKAPRNPPPPPKPPASPSS